MATGYSDPNRASNKFSRDNKFSKRPLFRLFSPIAISKFFFEITMIHASEFPQKIFVILKGIFQIMEGRFRWRKATEAGNSANRAAVAFLDVGESTVVRIDLGANFMFFGPVT